MATSGSIRLPYIFLLTLLCVIFNFGSSVHHVSAEEHEFLDVQLDGTLDNIEYGTFSSPPTPRVIKAKERLLHNIAKPEDDAELTTANSRYWVLWALYGFSRHATRYQTDTARKWRERYSPLSERHRKIISAATEYEKLYTEIPELFEVNGNVAHDVVKRALKYYDIELEELTRFIARMERDQKWDSQNRVSEALKHIHRDWSADGAHEREIPYSFIKKTLEKEFPDRKKEEPVKVLVPGSGLGRLAHDIGKAGGFEVTACELSTYMRVVYRYLEGLAAENSVTYHPAIDWWSHQPDKAELIRATQFPDDPMDSAANNVVLVEGDFNREFANNTEHFDALVTFFFMDTAPNMMEYFDTISKVLKPGALWINLGPLKYYEAATEFSLEDVISIAQYYGFEFVEADEEWGPLILKDHKARGRVIPYLYPETSLRRNTYVASLFVAKFKGRPDAVKEE